ncbi:glycoside hydrolase family 16 protein [Jidongwangia harbinensis]|uniref:glycoside hydrolase family 16 protein n=1 Tax=Jidongwangia harbinensis TaxID=2878561 RepID=UPI001CD94F61|nr:glycoside hydrolase family 16 protein [Jidongwangia harbinensis]MCA2212654.1 glycoside hydrolase family 16 protein [Jidongwangia harbinensis]
MFEEQFTADDLDPAVWVPYYLPHWSSRAQSAATYTVTGGELRLSIPPSQGLWAEGIHPTPLRVSCVQTANFSGPVGSTIGGQPFLPDQVVREEQPTFWGYTPRYGHIEARMRGVVSPRSMVAFWMSGIEDRPHRSGEICVMEVFGDAVRDGSVDVGIGLHRFRDPALTEEWSTVPLDLDIAEFHTYGVDWRPGSLEFTVDGTVVRRIGQAPDYPVQLEIGVFDFPDKADPDAATVEVPELIVSHVIGRR